MFQTARRRERLQFSPNDEEGDKGTGQIRYSAEQDSHLFHVSSPTFAERFTVALLARCAFEDLKPFLISPDIPALDRLEMVQLLISSNSYQDHIVELRRLTVQVLRDNIADAKPARTAFNNQALGFSVTTSKHLSDQRTPTKPLITPEATDTKEDSDLDENTPKPVCVVIEPPNDEVSYEANSLPDWYRDPEKFAKEIENPNPAFRDRTD